MSHSFHLLVVALGLEMSEDELEEVNSKRHQGKTYTSYTTEAAQKKEFTELPFVWMIDRSIMGM
jgi:hypothetical protein